MIGKILKMARLNAEVSQKEMAARYGATPQAIANIEKAKELSTKIISKYLACLGKRFEIVIVDKEKP